MPPLLDHDWISHSTSPQNSGQNDLIADCSLFAIMDSILRRQYSPSVLRADPCDSPLDQMNELESDERRLKEWVARHPELDSLDQICDVSKFLESMKSINSKQKRRLLHVFCSYHKAVFFIFCPWIASTTPKLDEDGIIGRDPLGTASRMRSPCVETSLDSAFAVIHVASHIMLSDTTTVRDFSGVLQAWQDLQRLLPISLYLIIFCMASGGKKERLKRMPYLGIFGALLGRMALQNEVGTLLDDFFKLVTSEGFL